MAESKFWRSIAVALVAGLFYLGHGMHGGSAVEIPDLTSRIEAGDVATANRESTATFKVITTSDDGRTINVWGASTVNHNVHFVGTFPAAHKTK